MGIEEYLYFKNIAQRRNLKRFRVMQVTTILLLAINFPTANSNSDWIESCSLCHCNWNSGKKTADCKQKSLTSLPHDMSSEIQVIDLSNNRIAELQRDEFMEANFQNLHKLYMRSCTIKKINRDAFKGLGILIELDLSHNSINVLHTGTFSGLTKLRNVVINHNEIEVLNDYMFDSLPFLLRVELKFNRLKHIGIFAFRHLPYLTAVDLEGNKLRVLRKETFARFPKLISLSLAQNLWNCSCDLKEFRDFTIANRLYTPPTNCNDPPHMRSKLWNEISSNDFACKPCILSSIPAFVEVYSDNITLPCHIEGFPYPNVTWMFNKRLISPTDDRLKILNSYEQNQSGNPAMNVVTSELQIYGVKSSDNGFYTCVAENRGGRAEADFKLFVNGKFFNVLDRVNSSGVIGATASDMKSNIFFVICLILTVFLILIIIVVLLICWYCGGMRYNKKDDIINSPNGFISTKTVRTRNHFSKDGPVIMEMQKSLLNEINPVEKPPRRVDANDGCDDGLGITKTLLMDTKLSTHQNKLDDETRSIAFSDTVSPHSDCHDFIEENCGKSLPPDLLAFPKRLQATSPSMQSSHSNISEQVIYGVRFPTLTNAVYTHLTPHGVYGTTTLATVSQNNFMTLQHPKSRSLAVITKHQQKQTSFVPAPGLYSPVNSVAITEKNGYMTIPRKPRVPSWAPLEHAIQINELPSPVSLNLSETGTLITLEMSSEPVYDNLGLRTTAAGNSTLILNNSQNTEPVFRYTMRDRPLPATPSSTPVASTSNTGIIPPQHTHQCTTSLMDSLYDAAQNTSKLTVVSSAYVISKASNENPKIIKKPPQPPPKPKNKKSLMPCSEDSTCQLYDGECEDGTEV